MAAHILATSREALQVDGEQLYALGGEIRNARSEAELDETEKRIDNILKAELARNANGDGADSNDMAALSLAAQRLHYLMQQRRTVLRGSPRSAP
jgi:hypothetical protein